MSLIPSQTAAAKAEAARKKKGALPEDMPLNPPFPFRFIAFNPRHYGRLALKSDQRG